jgi:hypothetical protein
MFPLHANPLPLDWPGTPLESLGRFSGYQPNYSILPYLRGLLAQDDDLTLREFILDTALRFMHRYKLILPFPRHDFMDHNLPFAVPLNISQIHETFADLVKRATSNFIRDIKEDFPFDFLDRTLLAREQYDAYDFCDDIDYVYEFGPRVWQVTTDFYSQVGRQNSQRIWSAACRLHYEMRGVPHAGDFLEPDSTPAGDVSRCG